jgi:hypothetical protein
MVVVYKDKTPEEEKRSKDAKILVLAPFIASFLLFFLAYFAPLLNPSLEADLGKIIYAAAILHLVFAFLMLFEYRKYGVVFKNLIPYLIFILIAFGVFILYLHLFLGWKLF